MNQFGNFFRWHAAAHPRARAGAFFSYALLWRCGSATAFLLLVGCHGQQSALDPAGREAAQLARLFWAMAAGALLIWGAVLGLSFYSVRVSPEKGRRQANLFIVVFGAALPTGILAALLMYGLSILPGQVAQAPPDALKVFVDGEQWWWRVRYQLPDGKSFALANEIRLPVGEPVQFELRSSNVIHAFWIPSIGGKKDMIPGRVTHLALTPTRTGIYRGACAEYCGTSHAFMAFYTVVMEKEEFTRWTMRQSEDAARPSPGLIERGQKLFLANGCGACHAIRGTRAQGLIGPDLTHVGSRLSIGAGILPATRKSFAEWIQKVHRLKPGVLMPHFGMLPEEDVQAMAAYLEELK
ncbi:MAG: cytochrome c oxidase subunit II [Verrucomicrobiota bacterium]